MSVPAIHSVTAGPTASQVRADVAASSAAADAGRARAAPAHNLEVVRGAPPVDPARPAPGDRVDGVVGNAASFIEVATNAEVLKRTMETQKFVIDLLA